MAATKQTLKGYTWTSRGVKNGTYWDLLDRKRRTVAGVAFFSIGAKKWGWYVHIPIEFSSGRNPNGLARSVESAKAICEAIILGTDFGRDDSAPASEGGSTGYDMATMRQRLKAFRWANRRRNAGVDRELLDRNRRIVASVSFDGEENKWAWHVTMPAGWSNGHNPAAFAESLAAGKGICETIIASMDMA